MVRVQLIGEIVTLYAVTRWSLRRNDLPATVQKLRTRGERLAARPAPVDDPARLVGITLSVLTRIPADSRCLMRSLVVLGLLARRQVDTRLVIGVNVDAGFTAHAWVERQGVALLPPESFGQGRLVTL